MPVPESQEEEIAEMNLLTPEPRMSEQHVDMPVPKIQEELWR